MSFEIGRATGRARDPNDLRRERRHDQAEDRQYPVPKPFGQWHMTAIRRGLPGHDA